MALKLAAFDWQHVVAMAVLSVRVEHLLGESAVGGRWLRWWWRWWWEAIFGGEV